MKQVMAKQGDTIDRIAQEYYGKTSGVVEQLLLANQHVDHSEPLIKIGVMVNLPPLSPVISTSINLWD